MIPVSGNLLFHKSLSVIDEETSLTGEPELDLINVEPDVTIDVESEVSCFNETSITLFDELVGILDADEITDLESVVFLISTFFLRIL